MYATSKSSHTPKVHNIVLGGPVIAHFLKPIGADAFEDNAQQVFLQYVTSHKTYRIEEIRLTFLICLLQRRELMELEAVLQQIQ